MNILKGIVSEGFHAEYLISRIRGRRSYLFFDWYVPETVKEFLWKEKEIPWQRLSDELRWLYGQMNKELRRIFNPLYEYFELRTLIEALRYKQGKNEEKLKPLLEESLLSEELKDKILSSEDILTIIESLAEIYFEKDLIELYVMEGFKAVEERLYLIYFERTLTDKIHPMIKDLIRYFVDLKNLLALSKYVRWDMKISPSLIRGGYIEVRELKRVYEERRYERINSLVKRMTKREVDIRIPVLVESAILRHITAYTRKASFDPDGLGLIMDYIWRSYLEARNRRVFFYGKEMERSKVIGNIIYL